MVEVRLCKNQEEQKAGIGKVFKIDIPTMNVAQTLLDAGYPQDVVDGLTEYGYRVYLQKSIAEGKDWEGRSHEAVSKHLDAMSIPFEVTEWEKGKATVKSKKAIVAEALGISEEQVTDEMLAAVAAFAKEKAGE